MFRKIDTGMYEFVIGQRGERRTFVAYRNEAGFAHRDWELRENDRVLVDQLGSRLEVANEAYRLWSEGIKRGGGFAVMGGKEMPFTNEELRAIR